MANVHLDGRTLEGGGQLVRIALALSALTNQPLTIDHIRANRLGKKGLKESHLAAVTFLAHVSNSTVEGAEIGSTSLAFYPPAAETANSPSIRQEYSIRLPTPGSVFLVFQALYPYLLRAGALASITDPICVDITGGTNVSFSPSFDYIGQVLGPNFSRLGLPCLSVQLQKRGWGAEPKDLGTVRIFIHPLRPERVTCYGFPSINLDDHPRGKITQIDVTVLAPDNVIQDKDKLTVRGSIENDTIQGLRQRIAELPPSIFQTASSSSPDPEPIPIQIHTSERTHHRSHIYVLLVAHTSTGFRIGRDTLTGDTQGTSAPRSNRRKPPGQKANSIFSIRQLIQRCIDNFLNELFNPSLDGRDHEGKQRPCVDEYMRDQLVVFEALGGVYSSSEDERYWSLHTQTARWVCEQVLA